jgi:hypothetical protein
MRGASLLPPAIRPPNRSAAESEQEKRMARDNERTKRIAELNDAFRKGMATGRVHMTAGVNGKGGEFVSKALVKVMTFDDFNAGNDPHQEHDFGSFDFAGEKLFWKIDYYNKALDGGSEDPADPAQTTRVLTIMLAQEY